MPREKRVFKYEHWRGLTAEEFSMLSKWEQREYNKLIKKKLEREKMKKKYTIKDVLRAEGVGRTICKGHDTPSRETIQMIDELKTTIKVTCNQMENIEKKVDAGFKENSEQHKELVDMLSKNLDKKADKEVVAKLQENQIWIARLVISLIVSGVIGFIFFK